MRILSSGRLTSVATMALMHAGQSSADTKVQARTLGVMSIDRDGKAPDDFGNSGGSGHLQSSAGASISDTDVANTATTDLTSADPPAAHGRC